MSESAVGDVILRTEDVYKTYPDGQVCALVDVKVTIRRGEYVAIMGPSGSGKSTLLGVLGALDEPTQGAGVFRGTPVPGHGKPRSFPVTTSWIRLSIFSSAADADRSGERANPDV